MRNSSLSLALVLGVLVAPHAVAQKTDTSQFDVTLTVRSVAPDRQARFKAAFVVDDVRGLQFLEATTPFVVRGRTRGATAILEAISGQPDLDALLVAGAGSDTLTVAGASGPRLVVQYEPPSLLMQAALKNALSRSAEREPTQAQLAAAVRANETALAADTNSGLWLILTAGGIVEASGVVSPYVRSASSEDIFELLPRLEHRPVASFGFRWSRSVSLGRTVQVLVAVLR